MPQFIGPYTYQPQPSPTTGGGGGGGADCEKLNAIYVMSIASTLGLGRSGWSGHCPFPEEFCRPQPCDGAALTPIPVTPLPTPDPITNYANSNYGQPLPIVFGADKLKGNVIWAYSEPGYYTNEETGEQGTYQTVDFALAICEGELVDVLRIWSGNRLIFDNSANTDVNGIVQADADGNLQSLQVDITDPDGPLGGVAISSKTTTFTVYRGTETQLPPQRMLEIEGGCITCAHRGVAYLFVENYVSADGSVPDLSVEVLANTEGLVPRSYFTCPTPEESFDKLMTYTCIMDPSYNTITVSGMDNSGGGAGVNVDGYVLINNTTFEQIRQLEVEPNYSGSLSYRPRQTLALSNGHYLQGAAFGNAHTISVVNAYTGLVNDILGPGGGTLTTMASDGFALLQDTCFSFVARGADGMPADIFCAFSSNGGCWAFAEVNPRDNTLNMLSYGNAAFTTSDELLGYALQLPPSLQAANPTFADGVTSTYGTNIVVFSLNTDETADIEVYALSYDNAQVGADPFNPVLTLIDTISLDRLYGVGVATHLAKVMYDPSDACFILVTRATATGYTNVQRMVKYNPFSGEFVWEAPVEYGEIGNRTWGTTEMIVNNKYAWSDWSSGRVYQINTVDGAVTMPIPSLTAQSLPAAVNTGVGQFYNGFENSLLYISNTVGKQLVKIYLGRTARSAVTVSDVVTKLLKRVGVSDELIGVDDLTALTLDGYTISNPNSLQGIYSELATVFSFDMIESNGQIVYKGRGSASVDTIPHEDLTDVDANGWLAERNDPEFAASRKIAITYRDTDREYEPNVQNFTLPKFTNLDFDADAPIEVTVPIVLSSAVAKQLAEILLYSKVVYETSFNFKLPTRYAHLEPGDTITLSMSPTRDVVCRIREMSDGAGVTIEITAVYEDPDIYTDQVNVFGIAGRFSGSTIATLDQPIDVEVLPIPYAYPDVLANYEANYLFTMTAFNTAEGQTLLSRDFKVTVDGSDEFLVPGISTFPTWGTVLSPLSPLVSYYSIDRTSTLTVKMLSTSGAAFASAASEDAMINNSAINLAVIGGEMFQFQTVTDNGDGTHTLSNFIRAKYGTDPSVFGHVVGERFVLIGDNTGALDYDSFRTLTVPFGGTPSKVITAKLASNNPFQRALVRRVLATNLRPWSVSALEASYDGSGNADFTWQYRVRYNGQFVDDGAEGITFTDGDTPEYTIFLTDNITTFRPDDSATYLRKTATSVESYQYTAAMQASDLFDNTTDNLYILVYVSSSVTGQETGVVNAKLLEPL